MPVLSGNPTVRQVLARGHIAPSALRPCRERISGVMR